MKQTEYMKGWSHAGWLTFIMTAVLFTIFLFIGECSAQMMISTHFPESSAGTPAYQDDVLECTSAGTAYISSTENDGIFEFDIYKTDASQYDVWLIASSVGSWVGSIVFRSQNTETLNAYRNGGVMCATASSTISAGTWYTIKIDIQEASYGTNTFYLDDVLWTAASGSNPKSDTRQSSSTVFGLDLDTGDKIRNVKISSTDYTNLNSFVGTGTGTYTFTDN